MADGWHETTGDDSFRFFSAEQVDEILRRSTRSGREGVHAAIARILKVEPGLKRPELWQRLRQLRFPPRGKRYGRRLWSAEDDQILSRGYQQGRSGKQEVVRVLLRRHPDWRPHNIWKHAAKLGLIRKTSRRGQERCRSAWREQDEQILLRLAGYKTPHSIARLLHRSEAAVRCHLALLGKSSRVHLEGFSRHELAAELHLGKKTVQRFIAEGLLEVRDPRVTRESIDSLRGSGPLAGPEDGGPSPAAEPGDNRSASTAPTLSGRPSRARRVWSEAADSLGLPLKAVEDLIASQVLKLYDPRITERSLRDFCRRYGSLINYDFLNRETKEWLLSSMDLLRESGASASCRLASLRKHALIVRRCAVCNQAIRGNVFFRHVKKCGAEPRRNGHRESAAGERNAISAGARLGQVAESPSPGDASEGEERR